MLFVQLLLACAGSQVNAADPLDWDVMAIFFPADQQRQVVPNNYVPIELGDLQAKLAAESERRKAALLNSPELVEAVYVAQLDKGQIVSDRSLWRFAGTPSNTLFSLGDVSVALRDARGIPTDYEQLSRDLRFSVDGSLEVVSLAGAVDRWFGFSSMAQLDSDGKSFDLRLPSATLARMLIATPRQFELSSEDVAVQAIADPTEYFPAQWPAENSRLIDAGARWWLVNLSGKSRMRLEAKTIVAEESMWHKHTLRSADTVYRVGAESINLSSKFDFAAGSSGSPVRLRFSSGLRVKEVNIDGVPARWRSTTSLAGDSDLIELNQTNISTGSVMQVTASGEMPSGQDLTLPEIAVAESFSIAGSARISTADGIKTNRLEAEGVPLSPRTFIESSEPDAAGFRLSGIVDWMGVQPRILAKFSQQSIPWQTSGLTRFTVQTASISAATRMKLSARQVDSNEIRLAVGEDWFVDDVKLVNDAGGNLRAQFLEVGTNGRRRTEVVISWEQKQSTVEFELDVNAHSPRLSDLNKVQLQFSKLLTLVGAEQQDTFVIESGRYQLQLDQELLRFQRQADDLVDWQRAMLPQLTDLWILEAGNQTVPPITFLASTGTYFSKTNTIVRTDAGLVTMDYHIRCEPISGTLDRVKILMPASIDASQLTFSLALPSDAPLSESPGGSGTTENGTSSKNAADPGLANADLVESGKAADNPSSENLIQLTAQDIVIQRDPTAANATEQEIDILLPTPTQRPFEIRSSLSVKIEKNTAPIDIVVPGVPRASTAESIVILPKSIAQFRGRNAIELLPLQACCSNEELNGLEEYRSSTVLVAARVDASESSTLRLRPSVVPESSGWAWVESTDMRLWDNGTRTYRVQWDIEVGDMSEVNVDLPSGWELEHAFVDGLLANVTQGQDASVSIAVPDNRASELVIECRQKARQTNWLSNTVFSLKSDRAMLDLPVLMAKQRVRIPPSKLAIDSFMATRLPSKLSDRLWPKTWWQLIPPNAFTNNPSANPNIKLNTNDEAGWSGFELTLDENASRGFDSRLWIVERSTLSSLILACLLVASAVFWLVLGKSARHWWIAISALAIMVILVPVTWLVVAQLLLLSVMLAGFARMTQVILQSKSVVRAATASRLVRNAQELRVMLLLLAAAGAIALPSRAIAQEPGRVGQINDGMNTDVKEQTANIFGILLPLDEEGELSGSYVHIPSELDRMLSATNMNSVKPGPPKLVSAEYLLTTRSSSMNRQEVVQGFSAEVRIAVTELQTPIRLPFDASQLELVYGEVKDREVLVGLSTLKQESDAVVFKPTELGIQSVRLRFDVNPESLGAAGSRFATTLPPIANAILRINSGSNIKFLVNAIGGTERVSSNELLSYLGPIDNLDVSWSESVRLNGLPAPIEVSSETWLHASRGQLMAACQLRSASPDQPLPQTLVINIDANWEPVGTDWGDAKLTLVETPAFVNRRVYTTQFPTLEDRDAPQVLRVLLVPKNLDKLSLPFLSVQGISATRRTLAFSTTEFDAWKPDGIETWPELFRDLPNWGQLDLGQPKRVFRVPTTYRQLLLRRQANRPTPIVNELTDVHLKAEKIEVDYFASWESPASQESVLQLRLPLDAQISDARINGVETAYRVSERAGYAQLLFPVPTRQEKLTDVQVVFTLPQQLDAELPLPRITLERVTARRSQYRLLRAEDINCEIVGNETSLQWTGSEINDAMQLDSLELPVSEIELGSGYRELATLPLSTRCRETRPASCTVAIQKLVRGSDGWTINVSAEWDADAKLDFVYFDLPIGIRDIVSSSFARKFLPSADPSRTILSVVPAVSSTSKRVEFAFPLTGVSTQSLSIPRIRLLSETIVTPALALPTTIEGQEVVWKKVGRRLGSAWYLRAGVPATEDYQYYAHDERQTQINWVPIGNDMVQARLENACFEITNISPTEISGIASYWISPRGQLSLQLKLPENLELLGVELGSEAAIWRRDANRQISVTLQPNYLPVHLRLPLRWKVNTEDEALQIEFPEIIAEKANDGILVTLASTNTVKAPGALQFGAAWRVEGSALLEGYDAIQLDRWGTLVASTLQAQKGLLPAELEAWLLSWQPKTFGFSTQSTVSSTLEQLLDREYRNSDESRLSVGEFWQRLGLQYQLQLRPLENTTLDRKSVAATVAMRPCYIGYGETLRFVPIVEASPTGSRWLAAAMLAFASLLSVAVALRLKSGYFAVLSKHPWLYWLQLAAVAWLLLPVVWPSCILALTSVCMLASQLLDGRQRNRTFRRA